MSVLYMSALVVLQLAKECKVASTDQELEAILLSKGNLILRSSIPGYALRPFMEHFSRGSLAQAPLSINCRKNHAFVLSIIFLKHATDMW